MSRILNAIVGRAHWVYSVSEVVFERFDYVVSELVSLLSTLKNSVKCIKMSLDLQS